MFLFAYISCKAGESSSTSMFKLRAISSSEGKATSKPMGMCSAFSYSSLHIFSFRNEIPIYIYIYIYYDDKTDMG